MLGICASAWSATVYKWVDDNGVTHYSDQPNPRAQKLEITGAQTYGSPAPATAPAPAVSSGPAPGTPVCVIDAPSAGQVFLDTFSITGHVTLAHIAEDGQSTLRLDGQDISGLLGSDGGFALSQVERGEHSLSVQVTNARGEVICQSSASFSVRQPTGTVPGAPMAPGAPAAPRAPGVGVVH